VKSRRKRARVNKISHKEHKIYSRGVKKKEDKGEDSMYNSKEKERTMGSSLQAKLPYLVKKGGKAFGIDKEEAKKGNTLLDKGGKF